MRSVLLAVALTLGAAAPAGADFRTCRGADPENGITQVRVLHVGCKLGVAVAKRTNSVKCFLNGNRCTHRFRGRSWTCTLRSSGDRATCRSGKRRVRYRLG